MSIGRFSPSRVALVLFTAAVFAVDLLTPQGVEVWVLYLPVILAPVWRGNARWVVIASAACFALVLAGVFLSLPGGNPPWWDLLNRGMGGMAICLTGFAGVVLCRRSARLAEARRKLEREVANHRLTEESLRRSEERLRLAVEGAGMGAWEIDLKTGQLVCSDTHRQMLGYTQASRTFTREMWWSRIVPADRARVSEAQMMSCRDGSLFCQEYRVNRADNGETVWLAIFGRFQYDEHGAPMRFAGVSFDIARRKELESEVLQSTAREQRRIGQELHDCVGQELTGLGLMAGALSNRLGEPAEAARIARRLVTGLDRVHEEVLTLSRGLIPVQVEPGSLCSALEDLAARAGAESEVAITFEHAGSVDTLDQETATQLFRIAQEAVSNALQHGRPGLVRLSLRASDSDLSLCVWDDGVGMPTRDEPRKGMGLRIMSYRAEQVGGSLRVGASPGGGTAVTCSLRRGGTENEDDSENSVPVQDSHRG